MLCAYPYFTLLKGPICHYKEALYSEITILHPLLQPYNHGSVSHTCSNSGLGKNKI